MDLSAPYRVVMSKDVGAVLSVLAGTHKPMSGREVARLSGGAHATVARVLSQLVEHGLVRAEEAGSARLYTLHREHLAAEPILDLVRLRGRLVERLATEFEGWSVPPRHASLFGSAARGDGGTQSDIDVFLVRPEGIDAEHAGWRANADALPSHIFAWTGNDAGTVEVTEGNIQRLVRERPRFVRELRQDAVTLVGMGVRELFTASVP